MRPPRVGGSKLILPAAAALLAGGVQSSAISGQDPLAGLEAYIESALPDWDIPGLAVAVVQDGDIVFAQGFGLKELGRDDPIDSETKFQIGSVTKGFAAAALAALVDDGTVGWDDPVIRHLPWFRLPDPWITQNTTIRDLLTHRSGMPAHAYPALTLLDGRQVADRARLLDNQAPFRQQFLYSNQAYGIAGLIVEAVTGQSWGAWVEDRLLEPLEMGDSGTSPYDVWSESFVAPAFLGTAPAGTPSIEDAPGQNVAMPHGVDRNGARRVLPWQSYDNLQAAGSMVSTVTDMANWLRMHLGGGTFRGKQVLTEASLSEMHAPQIRTDGTFIFADEGYDAYGMGWTRETFHGRVYLSHGGGIFGFPAYVALLPGVEAGVVVLANGSMWTPYYPHQEIAAWVFGRLLDLEPRNWHQEAMTQTAGIMERVKAAYAGLEAARLHNTAPSLPVEAYAGSYESPMTGPLRVTVTEGGLKLEFDGVGAFSGDLEHWHHDVFRLYYDGGDGQAWSSSLATFSLSSEGSVAELDLGPLGEYRRIP